MSKLLALSILIALSHDVYSARILGLFPYTGRSHHMVFEPLLRKLAERGHRVTVVSFFPAKNPPANFTDISLEGIAELGLECIDLSAFENPSKLLQLFRLDKIVTQLAEFHPLAGIALNVCSKLVDFEPLAEALRHNYDLIMLENFNSDCMLGLLHVYGQTTPIVQLSSTGMFPWMSDRFGVSDNPSYVPVISSGLTNPMSFSQRLQNTILNIYNKIWFRHVIQLREKEIIEKHFGRRIPDLQELAKNVTLLMRNVFHSLNGVRPLIPGIIEVGGMHLDHNRKVIPNYIERFLNESQHGVILLSLGSLIKTATMPKYKEQIIIDALSKLNQRVIWKYENSDPNGTMIGNILRVKWLPQYELLQHQKVIAFFGHGGLLGMTEAISAGKPMLMMPFFADQNLNSESAKAIGLGTIVSYVDLTEKSLLEGLKTVLSPDMRISARRASKIWLDRPTNPMDTAVYWTERVIRWGHESPLLSASRDLPLYQYLLLDVALTFLLAFIVLIMLLRIILVIILRFISGSINRKEKIN